MCCFYLNVSNYWDYHFVVFLEAREYYTAQDLFSVLPLRFPLLRMKTNFSGKSESFISHS